MKEGFGRELRQFSRGIRPKGCSKGSRCKASDIPRSEAYFVSYVAATRDEATKQMGPFQQPYSLSWTKKSIADETMVSPSDRMNGACMPNRSHSRPAPTEAGKAQRPVTIWKPPSVLAR